MAYRGEGLLLDARHLSRELLTERAEIQGVDGDSGLLHLDQHVDERQLDVAVETLEVEALELDAELFAQPRRGHRSGAGSGQTLVERRCPIRILSIGNEQRRDLELQTLRSEVLQRVIAAARVHQVARDHRVHRDPGDVGAGAPYGTPCSLRVVRGLADPLVEQHRRDRAGNAVRRGHVPSALAGRKAEADD